MRPALDRNSEALVDVKRDAPGDRVGSGDRVDDVGDPLAFAIVKLGPLHPTRGVLLPALFIAVHRVDALEAQLEVGVSPPALGGGTSWA